jgi:hypothetical protein
LKPAPGLYEQLITRGLDEALRRSSETSEASREDLIAEAAPHHRSPLPGVRRHQGLAHPAVRSPASHRPARLHPAVPLPRAVHYVSHESEKPMRILWALEREMPPALFSEIKIAG